GRQGVLAGATHYSLLERPEVVADVCRAFLDGPPAAGPPAGSTGEVRWAEAARPAAPGRRPARAGAARRPPSTNRTAPSSPARTSHARAPIRSGGRDAARPRP